MYFLLGHFIKLKKTIIFYFHYEDFRDNYRYVFTIISKYVYTWNLIISPEKERERYDKVNEKLFQSKNK